MSMDYLLQVYYVTAVTVRIVTTNSCLIANANGQGLRATAENYQSGDMAVETSSTCNYVIVMPVTSRPFYYQVSPTLKHLSAGW